MRGYKKARTPDGRDVMVTILIPPHSKTNIFRKNVRDRELAKHRCEFCLVSEIKDIETGKMYDTAISMSQPEKYAPLVYNRGEYVRSFGYDTRDEVVCGGGIHFYISYIRALYHKSPFRNGVFNVWYDDGGLKYHGDFENGRMFHGMFIEYSREGTILRELTVRNNIVQTYVQYCWETKIFFNHKSNNPYPITKKVAYSKNVKEYKGSNIYDIIPILKEYK